MIFEQKLKITFTKAAQWIDANAYCETTDEAELCEYLFHVVRIRSQQYGLLKDSDDFYDFLIYCVSKLMLRYRNKEDPHPIKSISNYLKTVLSMWCAEYMSQLGHSYEDDCFEDFSVDDFADYLIDYTSENDHRSYNFTCFKVSDVVHKHLSRIPRKRFSSEWCNICISCLLTLIDRLNVANMLHQKNISVEDPSLTSAAIRRLKVRPPVLYHVSTSLSAYIMVLVNEIIHALAAELSHVTAAKVTVTDCLKSLLVAASNEEDE